MLTELSYSLTISMSKSWVWYCTIVLQDIIVGGNSVKCTQGLSVLFLITTCEAITISKNSLIIKTNQSFRIQPIDPFFKLCVISPVVTKGLTSPMFITAYSLKWMNFIFCKLLPMLCPQKFWLKALSLKSKWESNKERHKYSSSS